MLGIVQVCSSSRWEGQEFARAELALAACEFSGLIRCLHQICNLGQDKVLQKDTNADVPSLIFYSASTSWDKCHGLRMH